MSSASPALSSAKSNAIPKSSKLSLLWLNRARALQASSIFLILSLMLLATSCMFRLVKTNVRLLTKDEIGTLYPVTWNITEPIYTKHVSYFNFLDNNAFGAESLKVSISIYSAMCLNFIGFIMCLSWSKRIMGTFAWISIFTMEILSIFAHTIVTAIISDYELLQELSSGANFFISSLTFTIIAFLFSLYGKYKQSQEKIVIHVAVADNSRNFVSSNAYRIRDSKEEENCCQV